MTEVENVLRLRRVNHEWQKYLQENGVTSLLADITEFRRQVLEAAIFDITIKRRSVWFAEHLPLQNMTLLLCKHLFPAVFSDSEFWGQSIQRMLDRYSSESVDLTKGSTLLNKSQTLLISLRWIYGRSNEIPNLFYNWRYRLWWYWQPHKQSAGGNINNLHSIVYYYMKIL